MRPSGSFDFFFFLKNLVETGGSFDSAMFLEKTDIRGFFNFPTKKKEKEKNNPSNLRFLSKSKNRIQRCVPKIKEPPNTGLGFSRKKKGKKN
jgi:hypothetical protein